MRTLHNYHQVWQQYGFTPEFYYITQNEAGSGRESYPLRPELIESIMYLYRSTGDPFLLEAGEDILKSIKHSAKTPCGYATVCLVYITLNSFITVVSQIKDVRDHRKEDRMESFFLSETTKYLYLLFDTDNFIHNHGQHGTIINTPNGECVIDAGGYIFNTEAHPIDPSALHCCHNMPNYNLHDFKQFQDKRDQYRGVRMDLVNKKPPPVESENVTVTTEQTVDDVNQTTSVVETVTSTTVEDGLSAWQSRGPFEPQQMLERLRKEKRHQSNSTSESRYELLSCSAQKFLQRLAIMGEVFN